MLVDAATRVMARKGYTAMSLDDVLQEAGLSTRAFYRHFHSKVALLEAIRLQEAVSISRSLERVVRNAPDPVAALEAWISRFLDVFYQPRRAERAALLASEGGRESRLSNEMMREMRKMSCSPLVAALRAGHQAGLLHSPIPEADAYTIYELVQVRRTAGGDPPDRAAVYEHVVRFAWPALGLEE
jgi:AcrR family transcriptional regulator